MQFFQLQNSAVRLSYGSTSQVYQMLWNPRAPTWTHRFLGTNRYGMPRSCAMGGPKTMPDRHGTLPFHESWSWKNFDLGGKLQSLNERWSNFTGGGATSARGGRSSLKCW